jgi:hypothetical protein
VLAAYLLLRLLLLACAPGCPWLTLTPCPVLLCRGVYEGSFLAPLTLRRKIGQDHDVKFVVYDVQSAGGDTGALSDEERVGCVKIEGSVPGLRPRPAF